MEANERMGDAYTGMKPAEAAAVTKQLTADGYRITELEAELAGVKGRNDELEATLTQANNIIAELRARMFSISLLIRP